MEGIVMYTFFIVTLIGIISGGLRFIGVDFEVIIKKLRKRDKLSFREAMDLTGLPILILYQGDRKLNFILDTGATQSAINLRDIEGLKGTYLNDAGVAFGIDGAIHDNHLIELPLFYNHHEYTETFQVMDLSQAFDNVKQESGVTIHGILGNSFLTKYRYILDFDKMVAYQVM